MIPATLVGARFLHYAALVLLFGGWAYVGFAENRQGLIRRFGWLLIGSAACVLLGALAVLAATVAGLGSGISSLAEAELWTAVLAETDFGRIWIARLGLALLAVIVSVWWGATASRPARTIGILLAGGLLTTVAWTGHGAMHEGLVGQLHRWADALHLVAAGVWIGALLPLLWLVTARAGADIASAARKIAEFHRIGLAAVLTLLVTGLVNSFLLVGAPAALVATDYGRLLLVKLALFAAMVGLAARNRLRHGPALARVLATGSSPADAQAKLRRSIQGELMLAFLVLATVSVLGAIEPASA